MKTMAAGSVDLTVTSPPYDNLRTYGKDFDPDTFDWHSIIKELYRVTAVGGVVVWVVADATIKGSETGTSFRQALWAMECGFRLHDTMIYQQAGAGAKGSPLAYYGVYEFMFVFSKGRPKSINLIADRRNKNAGKSYKKTPGGRSAKYGSVKTESKRTEKEFGIRYNVWKYQPGNKGSGNHPAPFPSALARDHIISWSNEGDTVFDPMMGSGTGGVEAAKLKRPFIGCELDAAYFADAQIRIANANNEFTPTAKEKASGQMNIWGEGQ